jgi:hypothetical protein
MSTPPIGAELYAANGHYYQLIFNKITVNEHTFPYTLSYDEAVQKAFSLSTSEWDAHLATITDAQENAFVTNYLSSFSPYENAWIGAKVVNGSEQWVTGETTNYHNFATAEPTADAYGVKGTGVGYEGNWYGYSSQETTVDYLVEYTPNTSPLEDNLLTNPGSEPILGVTDDFFGWTTSGIWGLSTFHHGDGYLGFVSSYSQNTLSQTIDLISKGFSAETLDKMPIIDVGDFVRGTVYVGHPLDIYQLRVSLLDANHQLITQYDTGQQTTGNEWHSLSHTFMQYGAGLRYIEFERIGKDGDGWAGTYGAIFDDAYVHFYDVPIGTFTIDDSTPQLGQTLSAISTLTDSDGFSGVIHYTWMSGSTIVGTDATYTTVASDLGKQISAIASYTNTKGGVGKVASLFTDPVENVTNVEVVISPLDGTVTHENDGNGTSETAPSSVNYEISLGARPDQAVTLTFSSSNINEGVINQPTLTFNPSDCDNGTPAPQILTITGVNDYLPDGHVAYTVTGVIDTTDINYTSAIVAPINLTNNDDGRDVSLHLCIITPP